MLRWMASFLLALLSTGLLTMSPHRPVSGVASACAQSAPPAISPSPAEHRAAALFRDGHYTAARNAFADIIARGKERGQQWTRPQAETLFDLGASAAATGDLGAAVAAFRQSLAVFESLAAADDLDTALALEGLATVLLQQENLIEAQSCLDRALAVREAAYPANHPQLARLYALAALAAQLRGDVEGTEELYYKALMGYRRIHGNIHPAVAEIIQNIGTFYTDNGQFQAYIMYRQAADIGEILYGPWHSLRAVSLTNFGRLRWSESRFDEAADYLTEALAVHEKIGTRSHPDLASCLFHLGRVELARGRPQEAVAALTRAAAAYEAAWWRAGEGSERSLVMASPYPLLAAAHLELGQWEPALAAYSAHQGRLAALSGRMRELPLALAARRDTLLSALANLEAEWDQLQARDQHLEEDGTRARRARVRMALAEAETAWLGFQQQAEPGFARKSVSVSRLTAGLAPDEALVGWLETRVRPDLWRSWAFVVRPGRGLKWVSLQSSADEASNGSGLAQAALAAIRNGEPDAALARLRTFAVEPLAGDLAGVRRLTVVPSGFVAGFPVDLLCEGLATEVVYRSGFGRGPTAPAEHHHGFAGARVLVVADPPFDADDTRPGGDLSLASVSRSVPAPNVLRSALGGSREAVAQLPRLAGTRHEAEVVAGFFPGTRSLLGGAASETAVQELATSHQLEKFDIIHLATHALIDAERPGRSALVLSQLGRTEDSVGDGMLTAHEIGRTWQLNAELVTLSACATGLGRHIDGEGFVGFTQALMGVGARRVLVSLWPVDDRATALLMQRFYGNLAQAGGGDLVAALGEARSWLRDYKTPAGTRPFAAPRYWAGFVVFERGD
jgi:tetratricopeptide (TPR) repeat protein